MILHHSSNGCLWHRTTSIFVCSYEHDTHPSMPACCCAQDIRLTISMKAASHSWSADELACIMR